MLPAAGQSDSADMAMRGRGRAEARIRPLRYCASDRVGSRFMLEVRSFQQFSSNAVRSSARGKTKEDRQGFVNVLGSSIVAR